MDTIPEWIRRARASAGLSQEALGEQLGRTKGNISAWEQGRHKPTLQQLVAIAKITKRSKAELAPLFDVPGDVIETLDDSPAATTGAIPLWPFPQVDLHLVAALEPRQIRIIETAMLLAAADMGVVIKRKRQSA